ncbi:probable G-protein coupled receptor 141 [Sardina pilchardus]|uniref:probable G-protein coupled receptor 141 n=1 Tax=Sardina pilchardus TaxID=27697 RepID=UPI002E1154A7
MNDTNTTDVLPDPFRYTLLTMYTVILVVGVGSIALMIDTLKSSGRSVTTMAVFNLIAAHTLFLLTVPFRLYFYVCRHWDLGTWFCKLISAMIHAHIYIVFIFYLIILVVRFITFFSRRDRLEFYRRVHALAASVAIWVVILVVIFPVTIVEYGSEGRNSTGQCFDYGNALRDEGAAIINYLLCAVLLLVTAVLLAVQLWILGTMYKKYGNTALSRQEFWAQVKSLFFVMVILVCFAPYHAFRIYYVTIMYMEPDSPLQLLQWRNEIFLAVTAFSCWDMLIFVNTKRWSSIQSRCAICR